MYFCFSFTFKNINTVQDIKNASISNMIIIFNKVFSKLIIVDRVIIYITYLLLGPRSPIHFVDADVSTILQFSTWSDII